MKIHALEGGPSARPAPSQSGSPQGREETRQWGGRRRAITHLLLPLPAVQASGDPRWLGSHHPRLACTLGWPWVAGGLRELGVSGGRHMEWPGQGPGLTLPCTCRLDRAEGTGHYHLCRRGSQLAYFLFIR